MGKTMTDKIREKRVQAIFSRYNGAAVEYHSRAKSNKSVAQLCSMGSSLASGVSMSDLAGDFRK